MTTYLTICAYGDHVGLPLQRRQQYL